MSDVTLRVGTYNIDRVRFEIDNKDVSSFTKLKWKRYLDSYEITVYVDGGCAGFGVFEKTKDGRIEGYLHNGRAFAECIISKRGVDKMSLTVATVRSR